MDHRKKLTKTGDRELNEKEMLKLKVIKKESSVIGLKVLNAAKSLLGCEDLHVYKDNLNSELKQIKTGNNLHTDVLYRLKFQDEFKPTEKLLVVKNHFEKGDYVVMEVTKDKQINRETYVIGI